MKSYVTTFRFLMVFLLLVLVASCDHDDDSPKLVTADTSGNLLVEEASLAQLEQHPGLAVLFSGATSKTVLLQKLRHKKPIAMFR